MHNLTTRRFNAKNQLRQITATTNTRYSCIIIVFVATVVILIISVIYSAAVFPSIANKDPPSVKYNDKIIFTGIHKDEHSSVNNDNDDVLNYNNSNDDDTSYNSTLSILIRKMHESPTHLDAAPFLVGLGAEKSGSTSLGAALFHSGEYRCPTHDEIDVETKYWSDCFDWNSYDDISGLTALLQNTNGGRCSIKEYNSFGAWRNGRFQFEKSVDYLGLPYITRILSEIFVKQHQTKIFVMIRYPPPRISSTWKFFVGNEKNKMSNEYGNIERFTQHLLQNNILKELIELLKNDINIMDLDWKNVILPKWNEYMLSLMEQCKTEAVIAGFKSEFCNPSQLLRRAVGLSCYIIPLMQWIIDIGIDNAINQFRIIQSELYFENGKDIMDRLICWSKQGTIDISKCDMKQLYQTGSIEIKQLQSTVKSGSNDFSEGLIDTLHSVFEPCNKRLFQLLQLYPQLALKEFIWNYWHFEP